ncbi:MAG: rhodanese-like domain-containing protein [Nitrospiria bacterium]
MDQIAPLEVKRQMEGGPTFTLLDVRERWEFQMAHIPGSVLIPLGELQNRIEELDPDREIVTLCHHGIRSQSALNILKQSGIKDVKNLSGGIDAYSCLADPSIPRY